MPYSNRQLNRLLRDDWIPAAEMPHRAGRVAETVVRREVFRLENEAVNAEARLYADLYRALRNEADDQAARLNIRKVEQNRAGQEWRRGLIDALEASIPTFKAQIAATALRYSTRGYLMNYYGRAWQFNEMGKRPPQFEVMAEPSAAVRVAQLITENVYDDLVRSLITQEWGDLFAMEIDDIITRVKRATYTGMVEGEGVSDIMRRVRDAMGVRVEWENYRQGRADIIQGTWANFSRVQTLTRTVVNKASNDGAIALYRQNADVVTGYTWIAARDERTCPICVGLNGTTYALNDSYRPPAHPNCRCAIVPNVSNDWMVLPDAPPDSTFEDWLIGFGIGWLIGEWV